MFVGMRKVDLVSLNISGTEVKVSSAISSVPELTAFFLFLFFAKATAFVASASYWPT